MDALIQHVLDEISMDGETGKLLSVPAAGCGLSTSASGGGGGGEVCSGAGMREERGKHRGGDARRCPVRRVGW